MLGLIGGSGLSELAKLEDVQCLSATTPLGDASAAPLRGKLDGIDCCFLSRHGTPKSIPPHKINYRANLLALQQAGVERVVAFNIVGGIAAPFVDGALLVPHQIIDYSWGREPSFFDGVFKPLDHIDFTEPFSESLRQSLLQAASDCWVPMLDRGVYACMQGPRLETAAEVDRLERDGNDVIGMTLMPEAALARELGMAYASICLVVNPAAGRSAAPITMEAIERVVEQGVSQMLDVFKTAGRNLQSS